MMRRAIALAAAFLAAASAPAMMLAGPLANGAKATTGDTYVLPPSQYVIPPALMGQFFGSYKLTSAGSGSRLSGADVFITSNQYHDLYGGGSFYGYDNTGVQTSWTNILYNFRLVTPGGEPATLTPWTTAGQVARDKLVVTLFGWGSPSLGTLTLTRQPGGVLAGTIRLYGQSGTYPIQFRKIGGVS
jgi:hypothetical protein